MKHERRKVWLIARRGEAAVEWVKELAQQSGLHLNEGVYAERQYACRTVGLGEPMGTVAPLRAPHHSISGAAMKGSLKGHMWRAGEVALAHGGVLYLDDATEFASYPLEVVESAWRLGFIRYDSFAVMPDERSKPERERRLESNLLQVPTTFSLVVSTLPCPCGNRGAPRAPCPCTDRDIEKFHEKVRALVSGAEIVRLSSKFCEGCGALNSLVNGQCGQCHRVPSIGESRYV